LTVSNGGTVIVAGEINNSGIIEINGPQSGLSSTNRIIVGGDAYDGTRGGILSIANGAQLITHSISPTAGTILPNQIRGLATVSGAGSKWTAYAQSTGSSTATMVPVITVGRAGTSFGPDKLIVSNGGTVQIIGSSQGLDIPVLEVAATGTLSGNGTIIGNVLINGGTVSPGSSPGTLTIDGNYTQGIDSRLIIEIAGLNPGDFDVLNVLGTATFVAGTTIDLHFINSFAPSTGDVFDFLLAEVFASDMNLVNFNILGLDSGFQFDVGFTDTGTFSMTALNDGISAVPVPAAVWMFGSGLIGMVVMARRKKAGGPADR